LSLFTKMNRSMIFYFIGLNLIAMVLYHLTMLLSTHCRMPECERLISMLCWHLLNFFKLLNHGIGYTSKQKRFALGKPPLLSKQLKHKKTIFYFLILLFLLIGLIYPDQVFALLQPIHVLFL
jgi:hypothetical protein